MSIVLYLWEFGAQIPLIELAEIKYLRGPQVIKREETFLIGYVLFDKKSGYAEVDVVEQAQDYLSRMADEGEPLPKVCTFKDYYNLKPSPDYFLSLSTFL